MSLDILLGKCSELVIDNNLGSATELNTTELVEANAELIRIANLGIQEEETKDKLKEIKAELNAAILTDAPAELLDQQISAMELGLTYNEWYRLHGEDDGEQYYNCKAYRFPKDCERWSARKKQAKIRAKQHNLKKLDSTILTLDEARKKGELTVTQNKIVPKKSGRGWNYVVKGSIDRAKTQKVKVNKLAMIRHMKEEAEKRAQS